MPAYYSNKNVKLVNALNTRYKGKVVKATFFYKFVRAYIKRIFTVNGIEEMVILEWSGLINAQSFDYWFISFQKELREYYNFKTEISHWRIPNRLMTEKGATFN
jgi:hypothetical protein